MDTPTPPPLTPIQKHVNEAITKLRLAKGLTPQQLADYIKADRSLVAHIEGKNNQNKSYSLAQMNAAAFYLGVDLHDLVPKEPMEPEA
jgi:transcriptional regulator with XRE-family HTH domain